MRRARTRLRLLPPAVACLVVLAAACGDAAPPAAGAGQGRRITISPQGDAGGGPDGETGVVALPPLPEADPDPLDGRGPFLEDALQADVAVPAPVTTVPETTTTTRVPLEPVTYESVRGINVIGEFSGFTSRGLSRWQRNVPGIQDLRLPSTADGTEQPVLWLPPDGDGDRPLLVILHSWSSTYVQHAGMPYAMWAQENGWAVVAPEFRGRNDDPDSIGSDLAVQDVVDAIEFAVAQEGVDADRVYAVGYSGGGMMGLLIAGRHPSLVTAVAAWGPVTDLVSFYRSSRAAGRHYAWEIERACGGDPRPEGAAQDACIDRSPSTYLHLAREAGVAVYLGHGLRDGIVDPRLSARAFNQLADPGERFTDEEIDRFRRGIVPEVDPGSPAVETHFGDGDPRVLFARESASVRLVYFAAGHEMMYLATMRWFASDPF